LHTLPVPDCVTF